MDQPQEGVLSWRLSSHPLTLLAFLGFRVGILYSLFIRNTQSLTVTPKSQAPSSSTSSASSSQTTSPSPPVLLPSPIHPLHYPPTRAPLSEHQTNPHQNSVLIFILTMLLLSIDFYCLKNIAGRRLVGLRWWNEVNASTGETTMVYESLDPSDPAARKINATDKRFFWLALYAQPVVWVVLAIVAIVKLRFIWLSLVGEFAFAGLRARGWLMGGY